MRDQLRKVLTRCSRKRSIGLVIDDESITISRAVHTALGPVEVSRHSEQVGRDSLDAVLRRVLAPLREHSEWKAAPVCIGLPAVRLLFTHRRLGSANRDATGEVILHEALQLTNLMIDDLSIDTQRCITSRGGSATILAARKRYLDPLLDALTASGLHPHTVEPAAFGLLRVAANEHPSPRRSQPIYRVFLGRTCGLLLLARGARPMAWRGFAMPAGREAAALVATVGMLRNLAPRYCEEHKPDTLLLHGRPDLDDLATAPAWSAWTLDVRHHATPALDDGTAAFGVATACHQDEEGFNLARSLRPQQSVLAIFPWGQAAVEIGVLASAAGLLAGQCIDLQTQASVASTRVERHHWIGKKTIPDLQREKEDLTSRAELIRGYLGTRFLWANYTREIAIRMPPSMGITAFDGKCTFIAPGAKGAPQQSLSLQVEAPIPPGATVPAEIDALLANLRTTPLLKRTLPNIRMSALKWANSRFSKGAIASFNLVCTPEARPKDKAAAKKPAAKAGKA